MELIENYLGWDIYIIVKYVGEYQLVAHKDKDICNGASGRKMILKMIELPYMKEQIKENTDELTILLWEKTHENN